jgi:hypothetical protein
MAGLVPAIHGPSLPSPLAGEGAKDVDARDKRGHDGNVMQN